VCFFFFQAEDGIRDIGVLEFRRVLFRSTFYNSVTFLNDCLNRTIWYGFSIWKKISVTVLVLRKGKVLIRLKSSVWT